MVVVEHDLGRPRVLLADPSSERFRALHTLHLPVATLDANNDDAGTHSSLLAMLLNHYVQTS